jgi:amino acid adenylation domain-containing protein
MERTPELVACVLGILKAGGVYVPVEPWFPAERIAAVMRDSAVSVIIGASAALDGIALPLSTRLLRMDADDVRAAVDAESPAAPEVDVHPESLCVVIYTSGSTGSPKGVMLTHGNVGRFLDWMAERFPLAPGQVLLGSTSVAFDVHVAELHFALSAGATLLLVENALSLVGMGAEVEIAHASMVPTAARELLELGALPGPVRRLNIAGEAPAADLGRGLYAAGLPELNVLYGPTEDTVYDTSFAVPRDVTRMLLGRPGRGHVAYVLDARLNPVPAGVEGDIWLAGCGVTRGYLGRPGLTAEKYVPHPFGGPGERLYLSGDRGRWTADGQLEFAGRADFQVKIRGFRVELGEIESLLRAHPEVTDAVVVAHGTESAKRLAAYVIPRAGGAVDAAALAGALRARLPEYMVPSAFVAMDAFPRGSTGKLDLRALPEPDFATEAAVYVEPATETERTVAEIFAAVLKLERAGATDDFFALGGHSLLAMHVWAHVRDRCGVQLSLRALFEHPTVRALAAAVDAAPRAEAGAMDEIRVTARRRTVRAVRIVPIAVDAVDSIDAVDVVDADEPAGVGGD